MSLPLLAGIVLLALALGYRFYGRFIAKQFSLDDAAITPASAINDGEDFVPAKPFYLLGQHFSAIAAAGPIVGPIAACGTFGWLPCLLWIVTGVVFIGAVHDFSALVASVRHNARSVAEIVKVNLGPRAWAAILAFIWIALVYVIVAFTHTTAGTFLGAVEEMERLQVPFVKGGAVAAASMLYLLLAVAMGLVQKKWPPPLWILTLVFVPLALGAVWMGTKCSTILLFSHKTWTVLILGYCFAASLIPLWLLLQPRGYLGGFVLYLALAAGTIGIFFGGFPVLQPAFRAWDGPLVDDALFPFLFVTIACGACSGFHGLVCSGTTSKQISRESHCRPVGFGAMLLEGFVAVIALATVMIAANPDFKRPGAMYGEGLGTFLTVIVGEKHRALAVVFGTMAFSTFVFDTLDVATRLGRYILQELFNAHGRAAAVAATAATVGVPLAFVLPSDPASWRAYWVLFGTSNQLLAALTLLGVTVWLKHQGRKYWFTLAPMAFVMAITLWSLAWQAVEAFTGAGRVSAVRAINGSVCILLAGLSALLVVESVRAFRRPRPQEVAASS